LQIGTDMVLIITSTGDRLFRSIIIDDLERPWTPKRGVLVNFCNFWLQRTFQEWIATKCLKIRPRQPMHMKFSALNADFSSPSADHLGSRKPAHASVKEGDPWLFYWYWLV